MSCGSKEIWKMHHASCIRKMLILLLWGFAIVQSQGVEFNFVSEPTSTIASLGDNIILHCKTNVPVTSVEWYFNGAVLSPGMENIKSYSKYQRKKRFKDDRKSHHEYSTKRHFRNRKKGADRKRKYKNRRGGRYVRSIDARTHIDAKSLGVHIAESHLEIDHLEAKNTGSYYCISTIPKGAIRSSTALVQIARISNFSSTPPKPVKTGPGAAVIHCDLQPGSIPAPVIKWEVNGRPLQADERGQYDMLPSGSLLIKNATAAESNEFRCLATNPVTSQTIPAPYPSTIQVERYQSKPLLIFPHADETINMTARAGERILMVCISGDLSKFIWNRDNGDIPDSAEITEVGINMTVGKDDAGRYTCKMKGNSAQVRYNLIISEHVCRPSTEIYFNLQTHKDRDITMGCTSNLSSPTWRWYYNGELIPDIEESSFHLSSLHGYDYGYYQCVLISGGTTCSVTFAVGDYDDDSGVVINNSEEYFSLDVDEGNVSLPSIEPTGVPTSPTSHTIRWTLQDSNVKHISIKYFKSPHRVDDKVMRYPHKVVNVPSERRSFTIKNLEPATHYSIEMIAVTVENTRSKIIMSSFKTGERDDAVKSRDSQESDSKVHTGKSQDDLRTPRPPSRPRVNIISVHKVSLMWSTRGNGGSPILGYKVQMKENKERWRLHGTTKSYPYSVHGLQRGKSYKFRIIAFNAAGESKPSQASKSYPRKPVDGKEIHIYRKAQGLNFITIEWKQHILVSQIKGYYVFYRPTDSDNEEDYTKEICGNPLASSYTIRNVTPGTQYDVKVQAFNDSEKFPMSNVIMVEVPSANTGHANHESTEHLEGNGPDPNAPAREMAHQRNMIYLISGCIVAAIMLVLLFTVFCYWRKRGEQKAEMALTAKSKNGNMGKYTSGKKCDHMSMSKMNSNGQVSTHEGGSAQHSRNHSPHDTRCQCSRHHSNHSSLGRNGSNSYSSYPVSQVGYQHWGPPGSCPSMNAGPMHVIMDPRHYGIGRWVRGGEFCHIIPVDARKLSHDEVPEIERQYIALGGQMVTRTYDGNLTATADVINRPDHGYHSNEEGTRTESDLQLEHSENTNQSGDDDTNSAGAATSGIVTLNDATIDSRSPSPSNREDEESTQQQVSRLDEESSETVTESVNCEDSGEKDDNIETVPFLISGDNSTSVT